jgi:hypothetical protein
VQSTILRFLFPAFCAPRFLGAIFMIAIGSISSGHADQLGLLGSERVAQIAEFLPSQPQGYGPPCSDRKSWQDPNVVRIVGNVLPRAAALINAAYPAWDDDAYIEFSKNGQRGRGDQMIFARNSWIWPLVMAECLEYQGRFLPTIERMLKELITQKTWTLPAHDFHYDNFHGAGFSVDLVAAQLGNELAQALYMLGDRISPEMRKGTVDAIRQRVFDPVRKSILTGQGNDWLLAHHNWNAVCLKGVVGAALAVLTDRSERAFFVAAAETYSRNYIDGFPDDGYSPEGVGYWDYGFGRFAILRALIFNATSGQIDLFSSKKVQLIANFGKRIQMAPGNVAAFGDSKFGVGPNGPTMAYLDEVIYGTKSPSTPQPLFYDNDLSNESIFLFRPKAEPLSARFGPSDDPLRTIFPDAGVYVGRAGDSSRCQLAVSIKANGNTTHSHNDIGSYAIALGRAQPVGDPGGPAYYDGAAFSPDRYKFEIFNSFGHPVPVVDGKGQKEASSVRQGLMSTSISEGADVVTVDLSPAYDLAPGALVRTLTFNRNECKVTIRDSYSLGGPVEFETAITTRGDSAADSPAHLRFQNSSAPLDVAIVASGEFAVASKSIAQYGLKFVRVAIDLHGRQANGFIESTFTPALSPKGGQQPEKSVR